MIKIIGTLIGITIVLCLIEKLVFGDDVHEQRKIN